VGMRNQKICPWQATLNAMGELEERSLFTIRLLLMAPPIPVCRGAVGNEAVDHLLRYKKLSNLATQQKNWEDRRAMTPCLFISHGLACHRQLLLFCRSRSGVEGCQLVVERSVQPQPHKTQYITHKTEGPVAEGVRRPRIRTEQERIPSAAGQHRTSHEL
jgi:hypothetical protein